MLTHGSATPTKRLMEGQMLDFVAVKHFTNLDSPRVFATHLLYHQLPQDIKKKQCKIVQIVRDPRAVLVSYYHHMIKMKHKDTGGFTGSLQDLVEFFVDGKSKYNFYNICKNLQNIILSR